jgi:hypothetical protein
MGKADYVCTRLTALGNGMSIWRVSLPLLHEQEKNARVMDQTTFERLTANIAKEGALESLPLCSPHPTKEGEFEIISGHHRTRAAKAAGIDVVVILAFDDVLTPDSVKAKQLAHNSLAGEDDEQLLLQIYDEIEDISARIEAAIDIAGLTDEVDKVPYDEVYLRTEWEVLQVVFLSHQLDDFEEVIELLMEHKTDNLIAAPIEDFEPFTKALRKVAGDAKVRNYGSMFAEIGKIVKQWYSVMNYVRKGKPEKALKRLEHLAGQKD